MKKLFAAILTVLMLALLPVSVFAAETYTEGTLYYTVGDGSVTITGCFGKEETVEVPNQIAGYPVNTIASGAFTGNEAIKTVRLPDTVTTIQEGAFDAGITVTQKVVSAEDGGSESAADSEESKNAGANESGTDSEAVVLQAGDTVTISEASDTAVDEADGTEGTVIGTGSSGNAAYDEIDVVLDEEETETTDSVTTQKTAEPQTKESSPIFFLVIGIVAVVGAAAVIVLKIKKK